MATYRRGSNRVSAIPDRVIGDTITSGLLTKTAFGHTALQDLDQVARVLNPFIRRQRDRTGSTWAADPMGRMLSTPEVHGWNLVPQSDDLSMDRNFIHIL